MILVVLPFLTSFLVRMCAWMNLLSYQGLINHLLQWCGFEPLQFLDNSAAVILGMVYSYLPFVIFPLYASLEKIDHSLLEAAYDLGCRPWGAFWRITFPLSYPGILAGSSLVFIPAVGEYVIPELLGGSSCTTVGRLVWYEFFINHDWPVACALALVMMVFLLIPIIIFERLQSRIERSLDVSDQDKD
jgi:putrescine transport system permease protein